MIAAALDFVTKWRWYAMGLLVVALGAQTLRLAEEKVAHAHDLAFFDHVRVDAALAAGRQEQRYRAEETRRNAAQREIADESQRMAARLRADRSTADAARERLLQRIGAAVASARAASGHPPAAGVGAPADDAIGVFAELLGRADARAGLLASVADEAHRAGLECQRDYDALTGP